MNSGLNCALDRVDRQLAQVRLAELRRPAEADLLARLGHLGRAGVAGQDHERVLEAHAPALAVGQHAVLEDREQEVVHARVGLLDLVEEHHALGVLRDQLGQLPAVLVAHVAGRRADQLRVLVRQRVLGAVDAHQALVALAAEELAGERLGEFGLARAGAAEQQEGRERTALAGETRGALLDRAHHRADGLVLADDAALQPALERARALAQAQQEPLRVAHLAQHLGRRARRLRALAARLAGDAHGVDVQARVDLDAQLVEQVLGQQRVVGQELVEPRRQFLLEGRHATLHDHAPVRGAVQAGLDLEIERTGIDDQDLDEGVRGLEVAVDATALDGIHGAVGARDGGPGSFGNSLGPT